MLRELRRALAREGITFTHEITRKAHPKLTVTHVCGTTQIVSLSSSPRDEGYAVEDVLRNIHRFARGLNGKHALGTQPPAEV